MRPNFLNNRLVMAMLIYALRVMLCLTLVCCSAAVMAQSTTTTIMDVKRVIDGDSLLIADQNNQESVVRLFGISTPHTPSARQQAQLFLEQQLKSPWGPAEMLPVHLDNQGLDRYGVETAHVSVDPCSGVHCYQSIQKKMLEAGMSAIDGCVPADWAAAEQQAITNRAGFWGSGDLEELSADNVTPDKIGQMLIVKGVVKQATRIRNRVYLNFGEDWRNDFTIEITAGNLRSFRKADIDPLTLSGQSVRVRGIGLKRSGVTIEATSPCQIQILQR